MVGWHHQHDGHEFEQAPGVGDEQGSLVCCSLWGPKEPDMTEWLNWTESESSVTREENEIGREGKNLQKQIRKNEQNGNKNIHVYNYLKCKQIKQSNQKTETGWVDTKTRPIYMLSTRDTLQI